MKTLEQEMIARMSQKLGMQETFIIELSLRLEQARQIIKAFEEKEGLDNGNGTSEK